MLTRKAERFYRLVLPRLYSKIEPEHFANKAFIETLSDKPHYAPLVKTVHWRVTLHLYHIQETLASGDTSLEYAYAPDEHDKLLQRDLTRLSGFSNVRSLAVSFGVTIETLQPSEWPKAGTSSAQADELDFLLTQQRLALLSLRFLQSLQVNFSIIDPPPLTRFAVNQRGIDFAGLPSQSSLQNLVVLGAIFSDLSPLLASHQCIGLKSLVVRDISNDIEEDGHVGDLIASCSNLDHLVLDFGTDEQLCLRHIATTLLKDRAVESVTHLELCGQCPDDSRPPSFNSLFPAASHLQLNLSDYYISQSVQAMFPTHDLAINLRRISLVTPKAHYYVTGDPFPLRSRLQSFCTPSLFPSLQYCSFQYSFGHLEGWREDLQQGESDLSPMEVMALAHQAIIRDFDGIRIPAASTFELVCHLTNHDDLPSIKELRRVGSGPAEITYRTQKGV